MTGTATKPRTDEMAALRQTIEEQRRTIDALVVAAERRTTGEPDSAALATWQRNLTLQRRLIERTERIRNAEQLLRAVIDSIDAGLCILDGDGRIVDTNQVWGTMLDRVHGDRGASSFFELAEGAADGLGELTRAAETDVRHVLENQSSRLTATHQVMTAGGPRWWRMRVDPVRGHGAARAVLTLTDETTAVRTQEELRQATREASQLAVVARLMEDSVVIADADGRIEWVNDAFTRLSGYTRTEATGRLRAELLGADTLPDFDLSAVPVGGSMLLPEFESRTKDGRSCWMRVVLYRTIDDQGVVRLMAVERDITKRYNAEQAQQAAKNRAEALAGELSVEKAVLTGVISTVPHLIYWKDRDGRYVGHNTAFLATRGLPAGSDLTGRTENEIAVPDDLAGLLTDLEARVRDTGEPVVDHHATVTGPDHTVRTVLMSVLPQPAGDGRVGGVIGIGADVTRISALERQLNQANRLEAIGQLAAGIAHEINTPIQFVSDNTRFVEQSFTQLLSVVTQLREPIADLDPDLDLDFLVGEVPTALAESLEGLSRVSQIVRAMKDFSHPGHGRGDVDINRAVESTTQVARNEWKYHAELTLDLGSDVGLVPCYEGELKQVILNLIVNAAHSIEAATPQRGGGLGHITVRTARTSDEVRIVVADDGIGMDQPTQQRIFDPFFTTKEVGKGTGQGLSMAYATIVQKHGGAIHVESRPGAGATFTLSIPTRTKDGVPATA
ncbi:PAS domain-containing protein [Paractinoplanes rhizophilus]|uniref:histidine kinase n=1 Tax=Paractinoplanes rhizophilus TaxID=1416877 RepID=A0ABW2HYC5_9ACTN